MRCSSTSQHLRIRPFTRTNSDRFSWLTAADDGTLPAPADQHSSTRRVPCVARAQLCGKADSASQHVLPGSRSALSQQLLEMRDCNCQRLINFCLQCVRSIPEPAAQP